MASRYYFPQAGTTIFPLVKDTPRNVTPQPLKEYHALIPGCTEVAGIAVKDKKLKLTEQQARYWLDQGVLGEQPGEHHAGAALGKKEKK